MKKYILSLVLCIISTTGIYAAWNIEGEDYVAPYKYYHYFAGNATGMSTRAGSMYTWKITNGKIMDRYGNYVLSTLQVSDDDLYNGINVVWDCTATGSLEVYSGNVLLVRHPVSIDYLLSITNAIYTGTASMERAVVNLKNVEIRSGANININGYNRVVITPNFMAYSGSRVTIRSNAPALSNGDTYSLTRSTTDIESPMTADAASALGQNVPNPFNSETRIDYTLTENCNSAFLYIYNMLGKLVKTIPVTERGKSAVYINGSELLSGIYTYSLVVDNQLIDTRRMIVGK